MPRFDYDAPSTAAPAPTTPQKYGAELTDVTYKHSVVSSKAQDLSSLLTMIGGSSYNVDYYSQVLGENEEPRTYDPKQSKAQQQYLRIDNYELKLQGSINESIDPKDGRLTATGSAITYPYLIPNVGDVFIGDIGDGRAGLFSLTEVQKKTRFKQTCYEIYFMLTDIVDEALDTAIDAKVVKETHFVKDFIKYGQDPMLVDDRYNEGKDITAALHHLLNDYLSEFFSYVYETLLVPSGTSAVYDPFITKLILTLYDSHEHPMLSRITQLNTDDARFNKYLDIWTVLLQQGIRSLDTCFTSVNVLPARTFSRNPFLRTIAFSGIDLIVLPVTNNVPIDDVLGFSETSVVPVNAPTDTSTTPGPKVPSKSSVGLSVPDVEDTLGYVFSPEFYSNPNSSETQSNFENTVKAYLKEEHFDYKILIKFYEDRDNWTRFQRFYLTPVLMILLLYKQRSV